MSNFGAIFIHLQNDAEKEFDTVNSTLKEKGFLFTLRYHESIPWAQAWVEEPENIPLYLKQLSDIFPSGRLIGIACQSVADTIGYWEIVDGKEKRILEYGFIRERTWEKSEGKPQEWESGVFGDREGYRKGENMKPGTTTPHFSNSDIQKIAQIIGLPGFGTPAPGEKWTKEIFN